MARVVAVRYLPLRVTIPKATAAGSPTSTSWDLGAVILDNVAVTIPTGHAGLTGVALELAGTRIMPWGDANTWLIAEGVELTFNIGIEVGRGLVVRGYNTDVNDHSFYLRAQTRDITMVDAGATGPSVVPVSQ